MDARMQSRAEQLAEEFAGSATTIEELNQLMRLMMKSGLERMLDTEMDVHLGRRPSARGRRRAAGGCDPGAAEPSQRPFEKDRARRFWAR